MIILIRKSELFTQDPDNRFSNVYKVQRGLWKEMWRRYSILHYSNQDLADYFEIKTKSKISNQNIKRWLNRTKVYMKVKHVMDKGCESLRSEFFHELEWLVIKELTKNVKNSVKQNIKTLP